VLVVGILKSTSTVFSCRFIFSCSLAITLRFLTIVGLDFVRGLLDFLGLLNALLPCSHSIEVEGIFFLLVYCSNVYREIFPLLGTYVLPNKTMKLGHVSSCKDKLTGDLLLSPRRTLSVLRHWLHTKRYSRDPCSQACFWAHAKVRVACGLSHR